MAQAETLCLLVLLVLPVRPVLPVLPVLPMPGGTDSSRTRRLRVTMVPRTQQRGERS